jgi:hypothetical protein
VDHQIVGLVREQFVKPSEGAVQTERRLAQSGIVKRFEMGPVAERQNLHFVGHARSEGAQHRGRISRTIRAPSASSRSRI